MSATRLHGLLVGEGHRVGTTLLKATVAEWRRHWKSQNDFHRIQKSRTDREIPTFPLPIRIVLSQGRT